MPETQYLREHDRVQVTYRYSTFHDFVGQVVEVLHPEEPFGILVRLDGVPGVYDFGAAELKFISRGDDVLGKLTSDLINAAVALAHSPDGTGHLSDRLREAVFSYEKHASK